MSGIEMNQINLTPDGSRQWMHDIQVQQRRCDEENAALRNLYKRAKGEGENVKAMRAAIRATKQDPTEVINDLRHEVRYMALRRIPITAESLLAGWDAEVGDSAKREDDIWDAEERGYRDGRSGVKIEDAPYDPGSEHHAAWAREWNKGQAAIAREMGPDAEPADPSRKRPSRARQARIPGTEHRTNGRGRKRGPQQAEDGAQIY